MNAELAVTSLASLAVSDWLFLLVVVMAFALTLKSGKFK